MARSSHSSPDFAGDRPVWARPGFVAAALIVGLIVIAGVVIALQPGSKPATSPPGATGEGTPSAATPAPLPTTVLTSAPAGVSWKLFGQTALPFSARSGPRSATASTASGFEHSPTGALLAAAQISTRAGLSSGRSVYDATIQQQFLPGPDRDALLAALHAAPQGGAAPGELSQIAGFIYQSYSPDTAVIGLVRRSAGASTFYVTTLTARWSDGDWRLVAPPAGSWLSLSRAAPDLTGVVAWGAQ